MLSVVSKKQNQSYLKFCLILSDSSFLPLCPSIEKVLNNHLKLSELLIVIFGIPGLLAAGCVSGVLLLGQDPTILVT